MRIRELSSNMLKETCISFLFPGAFGRPKVCCKRNYRSLDFEEGVHGSYRE